MAIYLDNQTRPYLERLIKKAVEKSDKDFIAGRLDKMLKADAKRLENMAECNHVFGEYTGLKQCCTKCESTAKGLGTSWSFKRIIKVEEDIPTGV